jgi:hypothetical protein
MKSENVGPFGAGRRGNSSMRIPQIPMEWMDPMSWRLPSGKALAEFALQSGFLAPLMLSGRAKGKVKPVAGKKVEEAPETSGTFRETR